MHNNSDFKRPNGIDTGILLNTNNEALKTYKKTKKKLNKATELENQVNFLTEELLKIKELVNDRNNSTR